MSRAPSHAKSSAHALDQRLARARRRRRLLKLAPLQAQPRSIASPAHPGISGNDLLMMKRAIALANQAAVVGEVPVAAVVYIGDRVIAEAANNREASRDPVGHAELLALSLAGKKLGTWRLNDCTLAVTLEPCPMCAGAMVNARLGRLIYGTTDPKAGAVHTLFEITSDRRLNHRVEVIAGVLADECKAQLQKFFQLRRAARKTEK